MDFDALTALLHYHYWARDRMLDALEPLTADQLTRDTGSSFPSILATIAHVYFAEWVWHERWHGRAPTTFPSQTFADIPSLRSAWASLEQQVRGLVAARGAAGLNEVLPYTLFSGQSGTSVFWHMVQHVVNHATYHRGQVTTMLRQLGATPPASMDLIAFYRIAPTS